MDAKLTLTIYDIVTHLLPGAAILLSLNYLTGLGKDLKDSLLVASIIVFGYLLGALLNLIGLILFMPFYPESYKEGSLANRAVEFIDRVLTKLPLLRVRRVDDDIKEELRGEVKRKLNIDISKNRLGLFVLADTFVSSLPYPERDTLLAKEGFFRSLTALTVVGTLYFLLTPHFQNKLLVLISGLILTEIFRYAREYNRVLKNQQIYTLALIKLKK